jgi:hypothetical protein
VASSIRWARRAALAVGTGAGAAGVATLVPPAITLAATVTLGAVLTLVSTNRRLASVLAVVGYVLALEWAYATHVAPLYAYTGLEYAPPDLLDLGVVMALATMPTLAMPLTFERASSIALWILFVFVYIGAVLVGFHQHGLLLEYHGALALAMGVLLLTPRLRLRTLPSGSLTANQQTALVTIATAAGMAYVVYAFGLRFELPDLFDVYELRAEYVSSISAPFLGYVVIWLAHGLAPLLLVMGIVSRRPTLIAIAVAAALVVYSTAGFKSALFILPLVVGAVLLTRLRRHPTAVATWSLVVGVVGSGLLASLGSIELLSLLTRRVLLTPGALTARYYEFFSVNPTFELRHSVLSFLGSSPYGDVGPPSVIAYYLRGTEYSANANILADGMANFGLPGIVGAAIATVAVLWVGDCLTAHHPRAVQLGIGAAAGFVFSQTALLTGLMTGGVLLVFLIAATRSAPDGRRVERTPVMPRPVSSTALSR